MKSLQHICLPVASNFHVDENQENLFLCETYQSMGNELSTTSFKFTEI